MASPSQADRARRLLALLPYLRRQGQYSLADLASAVGTDEESIAADLSTLSMCGVDDWNLVAVYVEGAEAIVYGDLPALETPVRLTVTEARALLAALETAGADAGSPIVARLKRLVADGVEPDALASTVQAACAPGGHAHAYATLSALAREGRTAAITYAGRGDAAATDRVVEPWRLFASRGAWYLQAWSRDAGAERTFRLDRISAVADGGSTFVPPKELPPVREAAPDPSSLPKAEIVFASDAPDLTPREWPGAVFDRRPDGTVVASVPYAGTAWIARMVAARLGAAVVTAPEEVRSAVAALARDELAGL